MKQSELTTYSEPSLRNNKQFWIFQCTIWTSMTLLSYLSLNIWYTPGEVEPVIHSVLQSVAGLIISYPLRILSQQTWNRSTIARISINATGVLIASFVWTIWRITSFTWLTKEAISIPDWGGWINASVIVFATWTFSYHALKYYRISIVEQRLTVEAQNAALKAKAKAQFENFKRLEAEKLFRESQLKMLRYQLNPHFLLNSLNSVSALIQKDRKHEASDMLAKIGDFLRISLEDSDVLEHTLEEEIDALQIYLSIEKIRFGERLQTSFTLHEDVRHVLIPCLLLQPIVENSIKHAVGKSLSTTVIKVEILPSPNGVSIEISDDGPGLGDTHFNDKGEMTGIGMANVRQRLESKYGFQHSFKISNAPKAGVLVTIEIPHIS